MHQNIVYYFWNHFNCNNITFNKQILLKLLHEFILFTGFKLFFLQCQLVSFTNSTWESFNGSSTLTFLWYSFEETFVMHIVQNFTFILNNLHLYNILEVYWLVHLEYLLVELFIAYFLTVQCCIIYTVS